MEQEYGVKIEWDRRTFEDLGGAWLLSPDVLTEKYGKIDFDTLHFFDKDGKEFTPEGGGPDQFVNVTHVYKDGDKFVEFDKDDFFPDPWLIRHQLIYLYFSLKH